MADFLYCVLQPGQGIGRPSVSHAVVVIFLEFFAWGLLTTPMLTVSSISIWLACLSAYLSNWYFDQPDQL